MLDVEAAFSRQGGGPPRVVHAPVRSGPLDQGLRPQFGFFGTKREMGGGS